MSILCKFGIHDWEKEPSHKELIKETGLHLVFFSEGIQKGVRKCTNPSCNATQKVYRTGWIGNGGEGGKWKKLDSEAEKRIDSLPTL